MTLCYALKYVKIQDESVGARPIGWNSIDVDGFGHDAEGNDVEANKWATTCPYCGNLVEFELKQIAVIEEESYVGCGTCDAGTDIIPTETPGLDVSDPMNLDEVILNKFNDPIEYIDPIAEGLFDFEIDIERMPGLGELS